MTTSEIASPFSTGSGGASFEARVHAAFLATMLLHGRCPCAPLGEIISIRLQARQVGYNTDDAVITVGSPSNQEHRLLVQIKHNVSFSASDADFESMLLAAWEDFNNPPLSNKANDAILFITGPQSAKVINHLRPLLDWARSSAGAQEFFSKVQTPKFSSQAKQYFLKAIRTILGKAGKPLKEEDQEIWEFLKAIHLLQYDFDVASSQSEAAILTMLGVAKAPQCSETVEGLWAQMVTLMEDLNRTGGTISWANAKELLPGTLFSAFIPTSIVSSDSLKRLGEHTEFSIARISDELAPGVTLERQSIVDEGLQLLSECRALIISGNAGDGKSALAKKIIRRLSSQCPVFAFKADEFDFPHIHQALAAMGVTENLQTLSARFATLPYKILFIDAGERVFELTSTDAFADLLSFVSQDPTWKVILTCRTQAVISLVQNFILQSRLSFLTLAVPPFTDEELSEVASRVPSVKPYLSQPRFRAILKIPFYLKLAIDIAPQVAIGSEEFRMANLKRALWKTAIEKPIEAREGLPVRRATCFIEVAVRRARSMQAFVQATGLDPVAMQKLHSDSLIIWNDTGQVAPAHNLLEDWALYSFIENSFVTSSSQPLNFFNGLGIEPAIRRAFRLWLTDALAGPEPEAISHFILDVAMNSEVSQYWRDEVWVATLLSDKADALIEKNAAALLGNGKVLLKRVIHLLRIACKGPNEQMLKLLGDEGIKRRQELGLIFTQPIGSGWEAVIRFIRKHQEEFDINDASLVFGLLSDWSISVRSGEEVPPVTRDFAELSLKYFLALSEPRIYSQNLDEKFLELILKAPQAIPDEIRRLYKPVLSPSAEESMSHTQRLLVEHALKSPNCVLLCQYFPDLVIRVLENNVFLSPSDYQERYDIGVDHYFDLKHTLEFRFFPPSGLQGPFAFLLNAHSDKALKFILQFINRTCEAYANSGLDGTIPQVAIKLRKGESRPVYTSSRLWRMYRGTHVAPGILESALMALENCFLQRAESGMDVSEAFRYILENSNSVATLALLVSVATAFPNSVRDEMLPLLGTLDFYRKDLERQITDQGHSDDLRSALGIPSGGVEDIFYDERKKSSARPHRTSNLEQLTFKIQFGPLKAEVQTIIDELKRQVEESSGSEEEKIHNRILLKRIDTRTYEIVEERPEGFVLQPKIEEPDIQEIVATAAARQEKFSRIMRLHTWAMKRWSGETLQPDPFPRAKDALSEARWMEEGQHTEEEYDPNSIKVAAYVASCLIRDMPADLDEEDIIWCAGKLLDAVVENADTTDMTTKVGRFSMHGSRPAAAVLPLLLGRVPAALVSDVKKHIAIALTHAVEEVQYYAAAGIRMWLWQKDPDFARSCFEALLERSMRNAQVYKIPWTKRKTSGITVEQISSDIRQRLGRGTFQPSIDLVDFSDAMNEDLLLALETLPAEQALEKDISFYAQVATNLVDAEERRKKSRDHRERLNFEFRHGFFKKFAELILTCREEHQAILLPILHRAVGSVPELASEWLQQVLYTEDRLNTGDRFWTIWLSCARLAFKNEGLRKSSYLVGYSEGKKLIRTLLLADILWKKGLKTWEPLRAHSDLITDGLSQISDTPPGFAAIVRTVGEIGGFLLPDILVDLDKARERSTSENILEDENARYDLETLLTGCVFSMGTQIRSREYLCKATMNLLDLLINQGSSRAFQLREIIVSPVRVESASS